MSDAEYPDGYTLTEESWRFHQNFYAVFGRCMIYAEYGFLLKQVQRRTGARLALRTWLIETLDGDLMIVVGNGLRLEYILPSDWQPVERTVEKSESPPEKDFGDSSTLRLSGAVASRVLSERLQGAGLHAL